MERIWMRSFQRTIFVVRARPLLSRNSTRTVVARGVLHEKKLKKNTSAVRSTKKEVDQNSALQAACDASIARVTGCVYPREGYRSVTPLLMPGSTGLLG